MFLKVLPPPPFHVHVLGFLRLANYIFILYFVFLLVKISGKLIGPLLSKPMLLDKLVLLHLAVRLFSLYKANDVSRPSKIKVVP